MIAFRVPAAAMSVLAARRPTYGAADATVPCTPSVHGDLRLRLAASRALCSGRVLRVLLPAGYDGDDEIQFVVDPDAGHIEGARAARPPAALRFLYGEGRR